MTALKSIEEFMSQKNIAIAGVSRKKQKFGNAIYKEIKKKGHNVFPVNPIMETYDGGICYKSIGDLPKDVTAIIINTKPEVTKRLIKEAEVSGINHIWLQQASADKETIDLANKSSANIIAKECAIMFADPANGIHAFHKWLKKYFGKFPK